MRYTLSGEAAESPRGAEEPNPSLSLCHVSALRPRGAPRVVSYALHGPLE